MPISMDVGTAGAFRDLRIVLAVSVIASMNVLSASIGGGHQSVRAAAQVTGDLKAWEEVVAAYKKLRALPGWRERVTGQGEGIATRDVVPPKSSRSLTKLSSGGVETITVGQDVRYRMNAPGVSGAWTCLTVPGSDLTDPSNAGGTVEVARGSDTTISGIRVRTYTYAWTPPVQTKAHVETGMVTIYVGVQTGLPRRFVAAFPSGSQTVDYYDYGAKITITLPPCG